MTRLAWMLFALGLLTGIAVEDGDISSIDAARRLQVTHSLWTNEPPVKDGDYPDFGVIGRGGQIHAWYGIGQSLVMLPGDLVGSFLVGDQTPQPSGLKGRLKHAFLVYATFPLITAGCVVLGYLVLLQLGFGLKPSALGALGMLFGTTLLQWTQINQENNLTLLCFLATLLCTLKWASSGRLLFAALAGCTAGFALITRLPTIFETASAGIVVLALMVLPRVGHAVIAPAARSNWFRAGILFAGVLGLFIAAERLYHWHRFGSVVSTYIGIHQTQNPSYYIGGDWWSGVWTLFFSARDSVLWMDPGILLVATLLACFAREIPVGIKVLVFSLVALLLVLVSFYAPYPWPGGAAGWGSRYTTTPSVVLGLLGFALMAHFWKASSFLVKGVCAVLAAYAIFSQIGSLLFWSNFEELQGEAWGTTYPLVAQRWINFFAVSSGTFAESGLMVPGLSERIIRPNFMAFHVAAELGKTAAVPAFAFWGLLLCAVGAMIVWIWISVRNSETGQWRRDVV